MSAFGNQETGPECLGWAQSGYSHPAAVDARWPEKGIGTSCSLGTATLNLGEHMALGVGTMSLKGNAALNTGGNGSGIESRPIELDRWDFTYGP